MLEAFAPSIAGGSAKSNEALPLRHWDEAHGVPSSIVLSLGV